MQTSSSGDRLSKVGNLQQERDADVLIRRQAIKGWQPSAENFNEKENYEEKHFYSFYIRYRL